MTKHLDITIKGHVQGVGYRAASKAVADQLGVKGYVKNSDNPERDVFIEAEGDEVTLGLFLDWCHEGPEYGEITSVESHEGELKNYINFVVKRKG
jgi:acylphosphatase